MTRASLAGGISEPILSGLDSSPYVVDDSGHVVDELRALADSGTWVTLYPAPPAPFILGRLAMVDARAGSFVFAPVGEPTVPGGELLFVATLHGVKYQFSSTWAGQASPVTRLGAMLPSSLIKLQRRRFVRVEAPLGLSFRAEFSLGGRQHALNVDDLGLGGVRLRAAPREAAPLYAGRRLPRVRLLLGRGRTLVVDLDVRSRRAWRTFLLGEQILVGCRFIDLNAADEDALREAIAQLRPGPSKD